MEDAFLKTTFEVKQHFKCEETTGLSEDQIREQQKKYGMNGYIFIIIYIKVL